MKYLALPTREVLFMGNATNCSIDLHTITQDVGTRPTCRVNSLLERLSEAFFKKPNRQWKEDVLGTKKTGIRSKFKQILAKSKLRTTNSLL